MKIIEALKSVAGETDATVDAMIQMLAVHRFGADDPADGAFSELSVSLLLHLQFDRRHIIAILKAQKNVTQGGAGAGAGATAEPPSSSAAGGSLPAGERTSSSRGASDSTGKRTSSDRGAASAASGDEEIPDSPPLKRARVANARGKLEESSYVRDSGCIPARGVDLNKVVFLAGRQCAVPLNVAPPALLCAPEAALVHDVFRFASTSNMPVPEDAINAARDLCELMAHAKEGQEIPKGLVVHWFNRFIMGCGKLIIPQRGSTSAQGGTGANEGQVVVSVRGHDYLLLISGFKNESGQSGDPMYQAMGYYQKFYQDGARWDKGEETAVLQASGAPAFTFELQGCDLVIGVVYTVDGNIVAREPLTSKMTLLDLQQRMPVYDSQLAQVLVALRAGLQLLRWRYMKLAGAAVQSAQRAGNFVLAFLPPPERQRVIDALAAASISKPHMAQRRRLSSGGPWHSLPWACLPWARLPYPLSGYSGVQSLPEMADKALFKGIPAEAAGSASADQAGSASAEQAADANAELAADASTERAADASTEQGGGASTEEGGGTRTGQASGAPVLVKFVQRPYPTEVHHKLQELGLAPRCNKVQQLPGGWWMVEQEFLDAPWITYVSFLLSSPRPTKQQRMVASRAVTAAVEQMHSVNVVHGDLRPPNVMLRERSPNEFEVRFIDLEWAGFQDRESSVYPQNMARFSPELPWHETAGPHKPLRKEHDVHLLQELFQ